MGYPEVFKAQRVKRTLEPLAGSASISPKQVSVP